MNQNIIELDWRLKKDRRRNKKSFKYNSEKGTHQSYHSDKNRDWFKKHKRSSWGKTRTKNRKLKNKKNIDKEFNVGYWDHKASHSSGKNNIYTRIQFSKNGNKLLMNSYYDNSNHSKYPGKLPYWVFTYDGEKNERKRLKNLWNKLTDKEKGIVYQQSQNDNEYNWPCTYPRKKEKHKFISFDYFETYEFHFLEQLIKKIFRQRNYIHEN